MKAISKISSLTYNQAMNTPKHTESGNVLFYILIAVALLAALSFAVSDSNRGSVQTLSDDRARLYATELIENANILSSAVSQLRLRSVELDQLCFDHPNFAPNDYNHAGCADTFNQLYDLNGAGITWTNVSAELGDTSAGADNLFHYYGDNEIEGIGTTCGNAGCSDLILLVDELQLSVCQQINTLLNITPAVTAPPTDSDYGETRYIGAFGFSETIGDEAGGTTLSGRTEGCFERTTGGEYAFYKVLIAR